jgi:ferric-dicitrate binding protein FerR (iron transport regulator)
MHPKPLPTLLRKIESGEATISELAELFKHLLAQELSVEDQSAVYQTLARKRQAFVTSGDPRLNDWISEVTRAFMIAGVSGDVAHEIFGNLTSCPDADSLTIALQQLLNYVPNEKTSSRLPPIAIILAVAVVLLMIAWLAWNHFAPPDLDTNVCSVNSSYIQGPHLLELPDGSEIIVAASSALCYATPFAGNGRREVALQEGQAYFEISSDAENPFFIQTPAGVMAEIRGTGLNISVDKVQQVISIAVAHGNVIVHYNGDTTNLRPGQQWSIAVSSHETLIANFDPSSVTWPYPYLDFDDVTLAAVAKELEKRFHVTVQFQDEAFKKIKVIASFNDDAVQLKYIILMLNTALNHDNVQIKQRGDTIIVCKKLVYKELQSPHRVPRK